MITILTLIFGVTLAVCQSAAAADNPTRQAPAVPAQSTPVTLETKHGADPTLAINPQSGAVYAAWTRKTGKAKSEVVLVRSDDAGQHFTKPIVVSGRDTDVRSVTVNPAQVAVGPKGEIYVLYGRESQDRKTGLARGIPRLARSTDGGRTFTPAVDVLNKAEGDTSAAMTGLTIAPDGTVHVAWLDKREAFARSKLPKKQRPADVAHLDSDDATEQVRIASAKPDDLRFGQSVLIADGASESSRVALSLGTDGTLHAAWRSKLNQFKESYDAVRDVLVASSTDGGATWSAPVKVHEDKFKAGSCPNVTLGFGLDSKARLHAAWYTGTSLAPGVHYAVSTDRGKTFSEPLPLLTASWVPYADVKLALDASDNAWIAYEDRRGDHGEQIKVVRVDADGKPVEILSQAGSAPDIVARGDKVLVAWIGSKGEIQIQRFVTQ